MRKLLASLVLASVFVLGIVGKASAQNYSYGVVTGILSPDHVDSVVELGAGWVRLNFFWSEIEASHGSFDWSAADAWVSRANAANLKMFITLGAGKPSVPSWAKSCGGCWPNAAYWQDFVEAALTRYEGNGIVWGVWNEPNLDGDDMFATAYTWLFEYADAARDNVAPSERLAGPETSHHALYDGYFDYAMSGISSYLASQDVITVHWYNDGNNPESFHDYMTAVASYAGTHEHWMTEGGWDSCNNTTQSNGVYNNYLVQYDPDADSFTNLFVYVLYAAGNNCGAAIDSFSLTTGSGPFYARTAFTTYKNYIASHWGDELQRPAAATCSDWVWLTPTTKSTSEECKAYCESFDAQSCEWEPGNGNCYVEWGTGCYVTPGVSGWAAEVFPGAASMAANTGVVCSSVSWPTPFTTATASACLMECQANNADACEWEVSSGSCFVETGTACYTAGASGWYGAVLN